jgi:hypothetical protein
VNGLYRPGQEEATFIYCRHAPPTQVISLSKKQERIILKRKLEQKILKCPVCGSSLTSGYVFGSYPIFWTEELNLIGGGKTNNKRLAGLFARVNQMPSQMCENCGIIISQFK